MGIEPVEVSREISAFGRLKDPSAMEARIFMLRGGTAGQRKANVNSGISSRRVS
jgi:hypothetical protein